MSYLDSIKEKIELIRSGKDSPADIRLVSEIVFLGQLELDEYPLQEQIERIVDARDDQRKALTEEFDKTLIGVLNNRVQNGDVDAMVLLGQYYYDRPQNELVEDLLISETVDQVLGLPGNKDELARRRVKKAHEMASECFMNAYKTSKSIFAMYYLAMLWSERVQVQFKPTTMLEEFTDMWRHGEITAERYGVDQKAIMIIRQGLTTRSLAEQITIEMLAKSEEKTKTVTDEKTSLEKWMRSINHMLGNYLHPDFLQNASKQIVSDNFSQSDSDVRKETSIRLMREAMNERRFMRDCNMQTVRYTESQAKLNRTIRMQRPASGESGEGISMFDLIENVLVDFFYEVFVIQRDKYVALRDVCVQRTALTTSEIKDQLINLCVSSSKAGDVSNWVNTLKILNVRMEDPLWEKVYFPADGYISSIFSTHIFEILNNARRACLDGADDMIILKFAKEERDLLGRERTMLTIVSHNLIHKGQPVGALKGSEHGLPLIEHDLCTLNNDPENRASFKYEFDSVVFTVILRYWDDLLIRK